MVFFRFCIISLNDRFFLSRGNRGAKWFKWPLFHLYISFPQTVRKKNCKILIHSTWTVRSCCFLLRANKSIEWLDNDGYYARWNGLFMAKIEWFARSPLCWQWPFAMVHFLKWSIVHKHYRWCFLDFVLCFVYKISATIFLILFSWLGFIQRFFEYYL